MLGHPSFGSAPARFVRPLRLGLALALVVGLGSVSACGDSKSDSDGAHGGASSAMGGAGGIKGKGGSSGSGDAKGGDSSSGIPGDFDSVWKFDTAEVLYIDSAAGQNPQTAQVKFPSTSPDPESGREVEFYRQFVGDKLVTYAYYAGEAAYYRMTESALFSDDAYIVSGGTSSHVFNLDAGRLVSTSTKSAGTALVLTTTRYKRLEGAFPPSGWPSQFVVYESTGDAQ